MNQTLNSHTNNKIQEWLFKYNCVFTELVSFLSYNRVFTKLKRNSFTSKYNRYEFIKYDTDRSRLVFSGDLLIKENCVNNDVINYSEQSLYEWIFSHIYKIDDSGISIDKNFISHPSIFNVKYVTESPQYDSVLNLYEHHSDRSQYLQYKLNSNNVYKTIVPIYSLFKSNDIVLIESGAFITDDLKLSNFDVLDKKFNLKYKFNEVNGFMFAFNFLNHLSILSSFKNFPKIINSHFTLANIMLFGNYNSFPNVIKGDCQFVSCNFSEDMSLSPVNTHIHGDIIFKKCINEYYFLNELANSSNIKIDGLIYSQYFTGTLKQLKNILK